MHHTRALIISLLVIGIGSRLIPHYPNFTAIGAISLFAAAYAPNRVVAILIPFCTMLLSDMILNNLVYSKLYPEEFPHFIFLSRGALWGYAALGLIVIMGYAFFRKGISMLHVICGALVASLIFYLLSNFGFWATGEIYPLNINGLLDCYSAGLSFLVNQVMGDLFYSLVLFGVVQYVFMWKPKHSIS